MKPDRRKNLIYKNYLEQNFISDGGLKSKISKYNKNKNLKKKSSNQNEKKKIVFLFMKIINLKSKVLIFKKMKLRKIKKKKVI